MKLSCTVSALLISALASSSGADARSSSTAGSRRSVQLGNSNSPSSANLVKRVSLAQMNEAASSSSNNMQKKIKRQPLPNAAPIAAFGSIPSMNDGNMAIVGLSKRQDSFDSHNGKQGSALTSSNTVSSSNNSGSSASTSTDSTDDDAEECEEDDEDDDEDCEEDDSEDADDEECDEEDDEEEDCDEEDEDDSTTATSSSTEEDTAAVATAAVNVNLKQNSKSNGQSSDTASSSSSSKKNDWSETSSATESKATESSSSSSSDGSSQTGIATWYTQNGNAGACGTVNPDSAKIIALYTSAYANGDNCGRSVVIKNLDDGTQTNAVVADMCPSCGGPQDIDLSVGAFQAIDPEYQTHGVRNIEWYFTD